MDAVVCCGAIHWVAACKVVDLLAFLRRSFVVQVVQNRVPHLKGHVYVEYKFPDEAWKAWRALRLRWYGGRQIQAELIAFTSWDAALCGAFLQSRCARGNEACNYLHLYPAPAMVAPQHTPKHFTPQVQRPEQKHEDILQYYENSKAAQSVYTLASNLQHDSPNPSLKRSQDRSHRRRSKRVRSRSASRSRREDRDRRRDSCRSRSADRRRRRRSRSSSGSRRT